MAKEEANNSYKKFLIFLGGLFVLILGITLTLLWFDELTALFKGSIGIIFAISGLFALYALSK